jgi:hypothetical protein
VSKLNEKYFKRFKEDLKKVDFPPEDWLTSHKTKVIEARRMAIENFLQMVL